MPWRVRKERLSGDSLLAVLAGQPYEPRPYVVAELIPDVKVPRRQLTMIRDTRQLIVDYQVPAAELYFLDTDPGATRNRIANADRVGDEMARELHRLLGTELSPITVKKQPGNKASPADTAAVEGAD